MSGKWLPALCALVVLAAQPAREAHAQSRLEVVERGPGRAGALLTEVLSRPYTLRAPASRQVEFPGDSTFDRTLVVVGADVMLGATVRGDVMVVGGDLFLRPGAHVSGRAIAFGGGVYRSLEGGVEGDVSAFRDATFDVAAAAAGDDVIRVSHRSTALDYREFVSFPGLYGLRAPAYDRVDGVSLAVGPRLTLDGGRLTLDPVITYRSDLGEVDPALGAELSLDERSTLIARAERGTFTNDGWSRSDAVNSAASLLLGNDARNYWRATRVEASLAREFPLSAGPLTLSAGGRWEDARSVGPEAGTRSGPWSLRAADDAEGMLRPNPPILRGQLVSVLADGSLPLLVGDLSGSTSLRLEVPLSSPDDSRWLQATLNAQLTVPTFGAQRLDMRLHAVATAGDDAPPQRWSYLGGGSTLATLKRLEHGGDMLLYVDGAYLVPLPTPQLPMLGAPVVALRYAVGSAGVGSLPAFVQNVGGEVGFSLLRLGVMIDPATGRSALSISVSPFP